MTILSWREQMSLNYPPLDDEHKAFLEQINNAAEGLRARDVEKANAMFEACYEYVRNHFSHEEDVMERINYPELEEHIASHHLFIKNISSFRQKFEKAVGRGPKLEVAQKAMAFLSVWFLGHVISRDKPMKPYLVRLRHLPPRMNY